MSLPPGRNPRETNPWPNEKPGFIAAHKDRNSDQMHPTTGKNGGYDTNVISSSSDPHLVDIKNKLIAAPATEAKQDIIIQHVDGLETAVAGTNTRLDDVKTNTAAAATKLDTVISHVDGLEAALGTPTSPEAEGDGPAIGHLRRIKNAIVNLAADIVAGTRAILVAGSDGTKARAIRTATDGTVLTQLTGSNDALVVGNHDQTATAVTANGGQEIVQVYASAGTLAEIVQYGMVITAPAGATSGTHRLRVGLNTLDTANRLIDITAAFNQSIVIQGGVSVGVTQMENPSDKAAQVALMKSVVLSPAVSLHITYTNSTNAAQAGTRIYRTVRLERKVS